MLFVNNQGLIRIIILSQCVKLSVLQAPQFNCGTVHSVLRALYIFQ